MGVSEHSIQPNTPLSGVSRLTSACSALPPNRRVPRSSANVSWPSRGTGSSESGQILEVQRSVPAGMLDRTAHPNPRRLQSVQHWM